MPGPFESSFQQSQPGFSVCITFPSSPCGSTHIQVSNQPGSSNTTSAFGQCVGVTVTPFSGTTPKSADFTFPPACIQISVNPCSSSTYANQVDQKKSSVIPSFQPATSGFCPTHGFRQSPLGCQCVSVTSGSAFNQKPDNPWSPSTTTNQFTPMTSTLSNPVQSTPFEFCPNHGSIFGCQCSASKATPYAQTPKADNSWVTQPAEKLFSISAMPAYKEKSHEELRCEDYQLRNTGSRVTPYAQTPQADNGSDTTKSTGFTSQTPQADTSNGTKPAGNLEERGVRNCDGQSSGEMESNTNNTEPLRFNFSPAASQIRANPSTSSAPLGLVPVHHPRSTGGDCQRGEMLFDFVPARKRW